MSSERVEKLVVHIGVNSICFLRTDKGPQNCCEVSVMDLFVARKSCQITIIAFASPNVALRYQTVKNVSDLEVIVVAVLGIGSDEEAASKST